MGYRRLETWNALGEERVVLLRCLVGFFFFLNLLLMWKVMRDGWKEEVKKGVLRSLF